MPPDRDPNLENELRDLGSRVEYPPTPDLASSVKSRLDSEDEPPASRPRPSLWWLAAAALVIVVLPLSALALNFVGGGLSGGAGGMAGGTSHGGGDAASPGGRAAGGGAGAGNERSVSSPQGAQAGSAAAGAASVGPGEAATGYPARQDGGSRNGPARESGYCEGVYLGPKITLREARARSETPVFFPRAPKLGKPDEVYDRGYGPGFILLYRAGAGLPGMRADGVGDTGIGLLLTQTRGDVGRAYLASGTVRGEGLENVSVNGERGYWIPPGERRLGVARDLGPSTGVLLWERDGQALRLEADVSREEAVRIAESVR